MQRLDAFGKRRQLKAWRSKDHTTPNGGGMLNRKQAYRAVGRTVSVEPSCRWLCSQSNSRSTVQRPVRADVAWDDSTDFSCNEGNRRGRSRISQSVPSGEKPVNLALGPASNFSEQREFAARRSHTIEESGTTMSLWFSFMLVRTGDGSFACQPANTLPAYALRL